MKGMVAVRMLQQYGNNVRGDVCGFRPALAGHLLRNGAAERLDGAEPDGPATGLPDPEKVDPDVEVHGLDDRDPAWRERSKQTRSPLDKMDRESGGRRK